MLSFNLYEYGGINNFEHVTLYLDETGISKLRDSDTFIRYEPHKSDLVQISDLDGKISSVNFEIEEIDAHTFVLNFEIKFSKWIGESDVLLHAWNMDRREHEIFYSEVFEVNIPREIIQIDPEPLPESEIESQIHVPNWIKSTAQWWSTEEITDDEFVKTIEFLIREEIINISETQPETQNSDEIPEWVKKNAEWWADGSISNNEFINSITYLIEKNIIRI
ncbi:MAG: hypothetical protein HRU07_05420 [Nitrosopumilus sp.]|nr:hypothetical protein [Nitrosopumilus sp.]NRA05586.1 hypothetical protein [Nitrosopumilus sp.]